MKSLVILHAPEMQMQTLDVNGPQINIVLFVCRTVLQMSVWQGLAVLNGVHLPS